MDITWRGSPNFTRGRPGAIDRIVVHWFGVGTLETADSRFQNPSSQVSAHYGVSKGRVYQWVKESDIAYHAGNWQMNQRSIGIEHDATLEHTLSESDYYLTARLISDIATKYNIPLDRQHIIGHKEVKPTQCPGTIDIDKIIRLASAMTLSVQLVFNNQKYTNELALLQQIKDRMSYLSKGKISLNFLPSLYSNFSSIPSKVFMQWGEEDMAVDKDWFIDNIWTLNKAADITVLVGRQGDWQNSHNGITTFGHYYSEKPATFPALIQIVANESDMSWKWPSLSALTHYLIHEISHPLNQMSGTDKTHAYDYASIDGLIEILPYLDYEKINYELVNKASYERTQPVFIKKVGDGTLYLEEAGNLIPVSADFEKLVKAFPSAKNAIEVSPDQFLKLKIVNEILISNRTK